MHVLTYTEGNALLADPNPDVGAGGEAAVPNGSSIEGTHSLSWQLSPQVLGGTGRAGQTSLSSWTSGVEDNMRSGPGKAERRLPRDLISRAAKGTGA